MASSLDGRDGPRRLQAVEAALEERAEDLAVDFVFDRPSLLSRRPGLARTFFAERCVPQRQIEQMRAAFHAIGVRTEVFESDHAFLAAVARGATKRKSDELRLVYNGLGYSVGKDAFQPGRKALLPLIADSYGLVCLNSNAYACTITLHKFHSFRLLQGLGVTVPKTWQFRLEDGWVDGEPDHGIKVIAKSTYDAWAVGVNDSSVFVSNANCTDRVAALAESIGQDLSVQEFKSGKEVYVPVFSCPELVTGPPVESVLRRAPTDEDAYVTLADNLDDAAIFYRPFVADEEVLARLRGAARRIFDLLQMEGFGRIDFRVDAEGQPWVFDIAISPGMEAGGAGAKSVAVYGFDHARFVRLVAAATLATRGLLDVSATTRSQAAKTLG